MKSRLSRLEDYGQRVKDYVKVVKQLRRAEKLTAAAFKRLDPKDQLEIRAGIERMKTS